MLMAYCCRMHALPVPQLYEAVSCQCALCRVVALRCWQTSAQSPKLGQSAVNAGTTTSFR